MILPNERSFRLTPPLPMLAPEPSLQIQGQHRALVRSINSECVMDAAAQNFRSQTDGITEEWKSANNLYDKVFFFYHRTKHSHYYTGKASSPFSMSIRVVRSFSSRGKVSILRVLMKNLFLVASLLLLKLYESIAASPKINGTKNTKTNM